jgi:hypothetical protein
MHCFIELLLSPFNELKRKRVMAAMTKRFHDGSAVLWVVPKGSCRRM